MIQRHRNPAPTTVLVRAEGLEPPRLAPPEPKSGVSANSTTPAAFAKANGPGSAATTSEPARPFAATVNAALYRGGEFRGKRGTQPCLTFPACQRASR